MKTGLQRCNWRAISLLSAGIVAAITALMISRIANTPPPQTNQAVKSADEMVTEKPRVDIKAVQEEAWHRIQPHLADADVRTREATNALISKIEGFFESHKSGAKAFADAALDWRSTWELTKSREGHREFIKKQFSEYIFSQDMLEMLLKQAVAEYELDLMSVENEFLVKARADLGNLPPVALPAFSNVSVLQSRYSSMVQAVAADVAKELSFDLGRELAILGIGGKVASVVTKTLTAVATRLGISGAIIVAGGVSAWATLGAGLVIGIAVDALLGWIIGWFQDPVGDLTAKVSTSLDDVARSITTGDPTAWEVRKCIGEMAENHPDPKLRSKSAEVLKSINQGGALGLKYALTESAAFHAESRKAALRELVFEEGKK